MLITGHSFHRSFLSAHPSARMLEVSGRSPLVLGTELNAFRLMVRQDGAEYLVESAFQTSKVGSSPLARGLRYFFVADMLNDRIIPARAGFTR